MHGNAEHDGDGSTLQTLLLGDYMLFGTDGIRGEVVDSPSDDEQAISQLLDHRMISARLMRVVGEALTRVAGMDNTVIIGWDDRPRNNELVAALTVGLHLGGCKVIHAGICVQPRAYTTHCLRPILHLAA